MTGYDNSGMPYIPGWKAPLLQGQGDNSWWGGPATTTTATQLPPATGVDMARRDVPSAIDIGQQINDYFTKYQKSNIPNYGGNLAALSGRISDFLNPSDPTANYDVAMHGAEIGAGLGLPGGSSGLGAQLTGRLRQKDVERRAALGAGLLGQEVSMLPRPFDPSKLLVDPTTVYGTQADQSTRLAMEQARILNDRYSSGGGYTGGPARLGGYNFDPTAGTTRRTPAPIAPGPNPNPSWKPVLPGPSASTPKPWWATGYQNPDGSFGWGGVPPIQPIDGGLLPDWAFPDWKNPNLPPEDTGPDLGTPDPVLFGPSFRPINPVLPDWMQGNIYPDQSPLYE